MILKKEVISSNCKTGPKEILNNGEYGELFEIGDYQSLANKILTLQKIDEKKLEKHMESFNIEKIYTKFIKILEE